MDFFQLILLCGRIISSDAKMLRIVAQYLLVHFFWPARLKNMLNTDTLSCLWLKETFELGGTLPCLIFETIRGII